MEVRVSASHIQTFAFNPFGTNMFVLSSEGEAVIVDASTYHEEEYEQVAAYLQSERLQVKRLLLTHGHIDHIFGCSRLSQEFGLPWELQSEDFPLIRQGSVQAQMFGVELDQNFEIQNLGLDEAITFGSASLSLVHTPGHSPGSVTFIEDAAERLVVGDVIFRGSIGRTDLWQGSFPVLMQSIRERVLVYPDSWEIFPGHGPGTTVGSEKTNNPFVTGSD